MLKINAEEYKFLKNLDDKWKWIARDKNRCLYVFTGKPVKKYGPLLYWGTEGFLSFELFDEKDLFQFIQWEDEEPYNIAKLIEEYEKEREETEVKKDIEWAKNKIDLEVIRRIGREDPHFYVNMGLKMALNFLNQLDEPEVLSQELPVIPKFVEDWIEGNKEFEEKWNDYSKEDAMNDTIHFTIYGLFADYPATSSHVELRKPVLKWLSDDRGNYFKLVNAVRYGYELEEEEQKYYARIKGWKNITTGSEAFNWVYFKEKDTVGISKAVENKYQAVSFTKHEWNDLGINEHNADFVLVEEL